MPSRWPLYPLALTLAVSAAQASESVLPVLVEHSPAAYPEQALERSTEGDVLLGITVAEDGTVVEVEVLKPAGHGFDGPAREAAWTMRFTPALDAAGEPVSARIEYRYKFAMDAVPPLSIEGVVRERNSKGAIAGAIVRASGPGEEQARTAADERGHFRLAALAPGKWILTVSGPGLTTTSASVDVPEEGYAEGVVLHSERVPEWEYLDVAETIEVTTERSVDPAEREIDLDRIVNLPGTLGDPVRALQNLPGVGRAPFGSGQLLVRGTDATDTTYLVEGMPIPIAFHFTAVSTVLAPDMLSGVELIAGSASARYGRAIGGVVNLDIDDDLPKRGTTSVSADIFQATAFTRQRLGKYTALSLAARRSYYDVVLQPILVSNLGNQRIPRYYDAQLHLVRSVARTGRVSVTGLVSDDRYRVLSDADTGTNTDTTGGSSGEDAVSYRSAFSRVLLRWAQPLGLTGWGIESTFSIGPDVQELELSGEDVSAVPGIPVDLFSGLSTSGAVREEALPEYAFRHEWLRSPGDDWLGFRGGIDAVWGMQSIDYSVGRPEKNDANVTEPAVYGEPTVRLGPVDLIGGLRYESFRLDQASWESAVDPRLRAVFKEGPTQIMATWGIHSQVPAPRELLAEPTEPETDDLGLERARQASLGIEQEIGPHALVGLTAYHHRFWDLVVGRENLFRFDRTSLTTGDDFDDFANDGIGEAYGAELFAKYDTEKRLVWLAVSLSRSTRVDRPDEDPHPAEADQPVNIVLIGSERFGKWRLGSRIRLVSGPPLTPVDAAIYSADLQTWVPSYGEPYSDRAPTFFSFDVRVDRELRTRRSVIDLYLEVQNATNHHNVEVPQWSEDYATLESITGLPILPAIGAKVTW